MASKAPDPLIVNLAPTGMVPTKEMTPHVPVSVDEVLEDVGRCGELGASIVHVHARDDEGASTHLADRFAPIVEGIRRLDPELVVCVSCSGRIVSALAQRAAVLELEGDAKPDLASLTLGSNNFRTVASVNSPELIAGLAERMKERGIQPELEVFEPGMVQTGRVLAERGLIGPSPFINIILGNPGTSPAEPAMLAAFLSQVPHGWNWSLGGIGRHQLAANVMAIAAGGHVRVGLEDNIWWDRERSEHASNPRLVARIAQIAELCQRPLATPAQTRAALGL